MIGQDFELPVQITASPIQSLPCLVRSLEEELQEAIQRAQVCLWPDNDRDMELSILIIHILTAYNPKMDPRQSIDDILDEPITRVSKYLHSERHLPFYKKIKKSNTIDTMERINRKRACKQVFRHQHNCYF